MGSDAHQEHTGPDPRAARLAAVRAYLRAPDAATREALWAQLVTALSADERAAGLARLRAWALDAPPAGLEQTPDYARYQDLLPLVLAGTLTPQSADYAWFQAYLEACDPCLAEYQELQHALDAERAGDPAPRPGAAPLPTVPADSSFLQETGPPYSIAAITAADAAWATPHRARIAHRETAGQVRILIESLAPPGLAPEAEAEEKTLLRRTLDPDPTLGPPAPVTLLVQARRVDPITCRLVVQVGGPGRNAGLPVRLEPPAGPAQEGVTDAQGLVSFALPIVALPQAVLVLSLSGVV